LKKKLLYIFLFVISSCKNITESNLELNIDPLTNAYKNNNVEYYLKIVSGKDTIYTIDSVCINRNGLITLERVKKGWFSETKNEYDSINRIIKTEHNSDINYKIGFEYKLDEKTGNLIRYSKNKALKKLKSYEYFKYEKGKLIQQFVYDEETKDTVRIITYKYNRKNKIIQILKNNLLDKYEVKTEYKYRPNNTLKQIIDYAEVKYISEKTGLIDSVKQKFPNEKTTYKYFYRKN
jgi:hypothetical protein